MREHAAAGLPEFDLADLRLRDLMLRDAAAPLLSMRARALEPHAEEARSAVSKDEVALAQPNTT
jgi:hypothetical protein